jgi:hypothetical protein
MSERQTTGAAPARALSSASEVTMSTTIRPGTVGTIRAHGVALTSGASNLEPIPALYVGLEAGPWRNYATGEPIMVHVLEALDGSERFQVEGATVLASVFEPVRSIAAADALCLERTPMGLRGHYEMTLESAVTDATVRQTVRTDGGILFCLGVIGVRLQGQPVGVRTLVRALEHVRGVGDDWRSNGAPMSATGADGTRIEVSWVSHR